MQTIDEIPATPTAATSQPRPAAPAKHRFPVSTRNLAAWAITAQVLFALSWIVAGWAQPTYSHLDQAISDLAARHARYPGILMVGMLVFGSGLVALVIALRRTVGVRARLGIGLLLAAATLMPVSALARVDCATSSAACRARVAADIESGQQSLHNLGGLLLFVLLCVSMLVWARRVPSLRVVVRPADPVNRRGPLGVRVARRRHGCRRGASLGRNRGAGLHPGADGLDLRGRRPRRPCGRADGGSDRGWVRLGWVEGSDRGRGYAGESTSSG